MWKPEELSVVPTSSLTPQGVGILTMMPSPSGWAFSVLLQPPATPEEYPQWSPSLANSWDEFPQFCMWIFSGLLCLLLHRGCSRAMACLQVLPTQSSHLLRISVFLAMKWGCLARMTHRQASFCSWNTHDLCLISISHCPTSYFSQLCSAPLAIKSSFLWQFHIWALQYLAQDSAFGRHGVSGHCLFRTHSSSCQALNSYSGFTHHWGRGDFATYSHTNICPEHILCNSRHMHLSLTQYTLPSEACKSTHLGITVGANILRTAKWLF